ncbi:UvrD-helicase domain-containing protein [Ferrovum myxofaciens]|uniref:UvrD-helicase domain-containing protein n=1 Tax=Ferrovum myxofaciens TaxID=416213 RepID=A0A9E6MY04_9PROT|nr:UvrD-helicase domain-containing protein [Ferrovum myxofaciens]QKE39191.1 MAG: UvrD-helicase domain-containing protein [Ferrovum myxofaciens]QWY74441.1 MAG: UvrD-helicase domain-containing protein [Ferrovum myxofaciens]QWY77190.1 MAG: UvrD-helicase domain-containing protein [Ferrovum myxofaciens]
MKILEYIGLDTSRVKAAYQKLTETIARDDFRAAQVKKLTSASHGKFYRAKLDDADRLLFSLVRHNDEVCALMLEVILNHNYDKSRFLRGATVDETKVMDADVAEAIEEAQIVRYLHPRHTAIHLLDKPLSFDDIQEAIYRQQPPLIIVGSAGSGKTALTLEKLKHAEGEVLFVTHSAYLAQSARDLYYANGFNRTGQEALFLSYREFIESLHVPEGREATWRDFSSWFVRIRQAFKGIDAHQAFEEIRGVLTARTGGILEREAYQALGVRQSIFADNQRDLLYDLFEKYRVWLTEAKLYDLNIIAQDWMALAAPRYDFVVIDEVQDLTIIQLSLVLKTLKKQGHFLLCGDSNQIVHPNFFSWAQVKSLFWHDQDLAEKQTLQVLSSNFRNGLQATRIANQLLKIKQKRFGSIDKESNFLVQAVGVEPGQVVLLSDNDTIKRDLDQKIRYSTQFAVLVMRDEDKVEARRYFSTPLLFSIHEAKGLEYENIILFRFISDHRAEFIEIVAGVNKTDLTRESLDYRRAKDKGDRSLEVYKFFVNALYVALTRATRNLYVIESDVDHPLLDLLDLAIGGQVRVDAQKSSQQDWQKEAHKLELQGKLEQAEAIRSTLLKQTTPPWPVFDEAWLEASLIKVFREQAPGSKSKHHLLEYAIFHDEPILAEWLVREAKFDAAKSFLKQKCSTLVQKSYANYFSHHFKDVLRQCDLYGIEHRLAMNQTPLMAAAAAGNVALVEALLDRGADRENTDQYGYNALHHAMRVAFNDQKYARGSFSALYELLAPPHLDVNTGGRLVRIDRHMSEYFLFQTLWVLFKSRFAYLERGPYAAFETLAVLKAWEHLPANVVYPERNKRAHISALLSRNELNRVYAYNRALFKRIKQGWYQFNPQMLVRGSSGKKDWQPVFAVLNLPLINEFSSFQLFDYLAQWDPVGEYCEQANMSPPTIPVAAEREIEQRRKT